MADINKALESKTKTDPRTKLPKHLYEFLDLFDSANAEGLPLLRGDGVDHKIELDK